MANQTIDGSQFDNTPTGWAQRWRFEMDAARKNVEKWHQQGDKIVKRFLDERQGRNDGDTRINLFTSNVQTLRSLLYGKTPSVDVSRRFADAQDDVARVAAEMLERLLNTSIESDEDTFAEAVEHSLDDRLLVGMGNVRVRYEAEFEEQEEVEAKYGEDGSELAPAYRPPDAKVEEEVDVEYVYWKDQLWSPCRVFSEIRWWAFRSYMTRDALVKRFGEIGKLVPLNAKHGKRRAESEDADNAKANPWARAEVWEIWCKEHKHVFWYVDGFERILDHKEDPLQLEGFFPFPRPMFSNLTTSALLPRPDFVLAQDLYNQIDLLASRITLISNAIRMVGVYDKTADGVKRIFSEANENEMIPVDNWAMFAEKGGIKGAIDFMPLADIVGALQALRQEQGMLIQQLYQVTGMSDIMRGQASEQTTATEQAIKARFASVRVQSMQDEFARFCSDIAALKAEIISKHYDPQSIIMQSNIMMTPDAPLAMQAVQLIKDQYWQYRVEVKPEQVSLTDYAALQQERVGFIQALAGFLKSAQPLMQAMPQSVPYLLQTIQWAMAGFKGSAQIEGVLDQAIAKAQEAAAQPPPPPQPDPRMEVAKIRAGAEAQRAQAGVMQSRMDMQQTAMDGQLAQQKHAMEMQKLQAKYVTDMKSEEAKQRAAALAAMNRLVPGGPA